MDLYSTLDKRVVEEEIQIFDANSSNEIIFLYTNHIFTIRIDLNKANTCAYVFLFGYLIM